MITRIRQNHSWLRYRPVNLLYPIPKSLCVKWLTMPLTYQGPVLGFLVFFSRSTYFFSRNLGFSRFSGLFSVFLGFPVCSRFFFQKRLNNGFLYQKSLDLGFFFKKFSVFFLFFSVLFLANSRFCPDFIFLKKIPSLSGTHFRVFW